MISHEFKCIFVHIRRTGGNSIEQALGGIVLRDRNGNLTDIWENALHRGKDTPYKEDRRGHSIHDGARSIREAYPDAFASYRKFSFVRNPWEQCVSIYRRLRGDDDIKERLPMFLRRYLNHKPIGTIPEVTLFDADGTCLMDRIGRFERLHDDFEDICRDFEIPPRRLAHLNRTTQDDYRTAYTEQSVGIVSRHFAADIQRFGYRFDV